MDSDVMESDQIKAMKTLVTVTQLSAGLTFLEGELQEVTLGKS